jgi:hypothetical protein
MSAHPGRLLAAALVPGAVAAAVLAGPGAAGASTGPRYASAEQAGYAATGAQFEVVEAQVYLRNPAQYAGEVGHYSHTVQLWSSGLVAVLGVEASTSGSGYTPYARIFDASSYQLIASNPRAFWCIHVNHCGSAIGSFPAGDTVLLTVTYNRATGDIRLEADELLPGSGRAFAADYAAGTGVSFTQARVGTEFGSDPWTAPASFTHPAAWTKLAVYSYVRLVFYNGNGSTLSSWFAHHKIFMAAITGSLIDVEAAPADLYNSGGSLRNVTDFQTWLAPAGVNGPAQPPQG